MVPLILTRGKGDKRVYCSAFVERRDHSGFSLVFNTTFLHLVSRDSAARRGVWRLAYVTAPCDPTTSENIDTKASSPVKPLLRPPLACSSSSLQVTKRCEPLS